MGWFIAILVLAYFVTAVVITKRYYLRRHGVVVTSGARGASTASCVGLAWPLTIWSATIREPQLCTHHNHALQRAQIRSEIDLINHYESH